MNRSRFLIFFSLMSLIVFVNAGCFYSERDKKKITIGSKAFTENILLGEMIAVILEERFGFQVVRKLNMGGTKLVFDALRNGNIDIYPEYTGTGYTMILKQSGETDPRRTL